MRSWIIGLLGAAAISLGACIQSVETNPFLTFTEEFSNQSSRNNNDNTNSGGDVAGVDFRRDMTLSLINAHDSADVNVAVAAWVNPGSIRSAEQQDALLRGGYVQLTSEVKIGSVFTLAPGTFVFNGPGVAGATRYLITPTSLVDLTLITPDVLLVFNQPPVSCDSVAFTFERNGDVVADDPLSPDFFPGPTTGNGRKSFAQVSAYQCEPLKPGMFLKVGGGARVENEYLEGESVQFQFNRQPNADGEFAVVTVGA